MTTTEGIGAAAADAGPSAVDVRRRNIIFGTILLGTLLAALDQTIVGTALPTIVSDLGGGEHMSWVVTAYLLAETVAAVLAGRFGDLYGRKAVFIVATVVFIIGSFLCGLAPSMVALVAWRAVQGIGAGGLMVTSMALIADVIPLRERGRYQGAIGAVFGVSTVVGPLLGGLFTDHVGWRWAFYVNVPLAVVVVAVAARTIPLVRSARRPVIDYLGIVLVSAGAAALVLATSWGGNEYAWGSPVIIGLFAGGAVLLALFCWAETRAAEPMLPMRLFGNPVFTVCSTLSFIVGFAMLGAMTYLPTYLQYVDGDSATVSGVRTLPMVVGLLAASIVSGNLVSRTGKYRFHPVFGSLVMASGLFLLSRMDRQSGFWTESLAMLVLGIGIGSCMQVLIIAVQNTVGYADLGTATSGVTFFRTLGSSFGTAVFGVIYANRLAPELATGVGQAAATGTADPAVVAQAATSPQALHRLPEPATIPIIDAYVDALHTVFLWAVPVALLAFGTALLLKQVPLRDTVRSGSSDMGEGFAQPGPADSADVLEASLCRILPRTGMETLREVVGASGSVLGIGEAWALLQVNMHTRLIGHATLSLIARRRRLPPETLAPLFDQVVYRGYLIRDGDHLSATPAGAEQTALLTASWERWLRDKVEQDIGTPPGPQLEKAVYTIAKRLLAEELTDTGTGGSRRLVGASSS